MKILFVVVERRLVIGERAGKIAVLEDGKVVEVYPLEGHTAGTLYREGTIVMGTVKKLMPSINAAFLDIGAKVKAFLHYQDLGPHAASLLKLHGLLQKKKNIHPDLSNFYPPESFPLRGKITDVLEVGMKLPVQVEKEPIATKGYRVSMKLSIPARYHVLMPFYSMVRVSRRIEEESERKRLQRVIRGLLPPRFGAIVRTAAAHRPITEIEEDIRAALDRWAGVMERMKKGEHVLYKEDSLLDRYLRDLVNEDVTEIITDSPKHAVFVEEWLRVNAPHKKGMVVCRKEQDVFKEEGIEVQLNALSQRIVRFEQGGYIVMDETEALHVFDVNSGSRNTSKQGREETVLAINLRAAELIAQILRLRDIGGLIVIDFIDMDKAENRRTLHKKMEEFMKRDRAAHTILPLSRFGLMQITRQRSRESQEVGRSEKCPLCAGTGEIVPIMDVVESIYHMLRRRRGFFHTIKVHPFVRAYLLRGVPSLRTQWLWRLRKWLRPVEDEETPINAFHFVE